MVVDCGSTTIWYGALGYPNKNSSLTYGMVGITWHSLTERQELEELRRKALAIRTIENEWVYVGDDMPLDTNQTDTEKLSEISNMLTTIARWYRVASSGFPAPKSAYDSLTDSLKAIEGWIQNGTALPKTSDILHQVVTMMNAQSIFNNDEYDGVIQKVTLPRATLKVGRKSWDIFIISWSILSLFTIDDQLHCTGGLFLE